MKSTFLSKVSIAFIAGYLGIACPSASRGENAQPESPFHSALTGMREGIREDGMYRVEGTITWGYEGARAIPGPMSWMYSLCFGPPAQDNLRYLCIAGGSGKQSLEKLVKGVTVSEAIRLQARGSTVVTTEGKEVDMKGYQPHIAITISRNGEELYTKNHLLQPVAPYKK